MADSPVIGGRIDIETGDALRLGLGWGALNQPKV
jgi:hypothetical protein